MRVAPPPENEAARLDALDSYGILDTGAEPAFDAITRAASLICGVSIALISLIDRDRQWFKSAVGLPGVTETPRDLAFCAHAILGQEILEVPDALDDARFADNPLVIEEPRIRFYAGMPLIDAQGFSLGTLCVIDRTPRHLTATQRDALAELSRVVVLLIERLRVGRQLAQLRAFDAAMFEASPDAVVVTDRHGRIVRVNERAVELFGYRRPALIDAPIEIVVPDQFRSGHVALRDAFTASPRTRAMGAGSVLHAKRADGTVVPVDIQIGPVREAGALHLIANVRDISQQLEAAAALAESRRLQAILEERERGAEALRQANEKLSRIIDAAPTAIFAIDCDDRVTMWNPAASRIYGIAADQALGQRLTELIAADMIPPGSPTMIELIDSARSNGGGQDIEIEQIARDGTRRELSVSSAPLHHASGRLTGILFIARDIGLAKEIDRRLRDTQKLEAIGQLTGGVAHDFNNLLAIIHGNLELLNLQSDVSPAALELIGDALSAATRGASLTQRLLSFSRQQQLAPSAVDVGTLVTDLIAVLRRVVEESVEIRTAIAPGLWACRIDAHQLENALLNLTVNARDAMPHGGTLTIAVENAELGEGYALEHPAVKIGRYVLVTVTDTGTGMPKEIVERALEPFFTTKPVGKGTGLGLSMVYGFVKQSGGHLTIHSELGLGTTMKLYLPGETSGDVGAVVVEAKKPTQVVDTGRVVLVVEDDPAVRKLEIRALRSLGYRTLEAGDGPSGLAILRESDHTDVLLTDVIMPGGMSGPELAEAAQFIRPQLRIIFLSGYTPNYVFERFDLSGAICLMKPFTRATLANAMREIFEGAPPA